MVSARNIADRLARNIVSLAVELLPTGHREGAEWRVGNIYGDAGASLGVHLVGEKAGRWKDFAAGDSGDALDLVRRVNRLDASEAMQWALRWLGDVSEPLAPSPAAPKIDPDRWRRPWGSARPIAGTLAAIYLSCRGLCFEDPDGRVMRFVERRARKGTDDQLEHHPALLIALTDVITGEQVGVTNVYLRADGADRLRDRKGKTVTGRARGAAMMLSGFDEPTYGLTVCEGAETAVALLMAGLAPVWAVGGAGFLAAFPVLNGIEALTIAADGDQPGQDAAAKLAATWYAEGREAVIIAPPSGDWADIRKVA